MIHQRGAGMGYSIGQAVAPSGARGIIGRDMAPAWYALTVRSGRERIARASLMAKGVHACYPERETAWKIRGRTVRREYPVIAGVIYAKFTAEPQWDVLKYRRIITGVYGRDDRPIVIPGDVIRAVMGLPTVAEELEAARREMLRVRDGDRARIVTGPLVGLVVDISRVDHGRVWFETLTGIKGEARLSDMDRIVPQGLPSA